LKGKRNGALGGESREGGEDSYASVVWRLGLLPMDVPPSEEKKNEASIKGLAWEKEGVLSTSRYGRTPLVAFAALANLIRGEKGRRQRVPTEEEGRKTGWGGDPRVRGKRGREGKPCLRSLSRGER